MNNTHTGRAQSRRRWLVTGVTVLVAAAGLTALEATTAEADEPTVSSQETFTTTLSPFGSINLPHMVCMSGYLEDVDYSPGRIVPRGVQVLEPGGVGVFVYKPNYTASPEPGANYRVLNGIDPFTGAATATNWDPFNSHDLTITLHCTGDLSKAAKQTFIPGFA